VLDVHGDLLRRRDFHSTSAKLRFILRADFSDLRDRNSPFAEIAYRNCALRTNAGSETVAAGGGLG